MCVLRFTVCLLNVSGVCSLFTGLFVWLMYLFIHRFPYLHIIFGYLFIVQTVHECIRFIYEKEWSLSLLNCYCQIYRRSKKLNCYLSWKGSEGSWSSISCRIIYLHCMAPLNISVKFCVAARSVLHLRAVFLSDYSPQQWSWFESGNQRLPTRSNYEITWCMSLHLWH